MNCRLSEEYMMRYFDGGLNDIEIAQMKQHLKSCSKCSKEYEELNGIIDILETDGIIEPPEDFELQVMQKVKTLESEKRSRNSRWMVYLYNLTALVCAVLLLALVISFREVDAIRIAERIGEYFGSFTGFTDAVVHILKDGYDIAEKVVRALFRVAAALFKTYYYIFITLLALLLAVQKTFFTLVKQGGGNRK